jgi:hypothetical protein
MTEKKKQTTPFKHCSMCGKTWETKTEFLADTSIVLNGYQWSKKAMVNKQQDHGILIYTHTEHNCGTSIAIYPSAFRKKKRKGTQQ